MSNIMRKNFCAVRADRLNDRYAEHEPAGRLSSALHLYLIDEPPPIFDMPVNLFVCMHCSVVYSPCPE